MGRKRTIDREAVLDAAEAVVTEKGAGNLTFEEVARRAGVSKGGVLYCFPSKQELVAAMARRDMDRFRRDVAVQREALGDRASADILAHLAATRHESDADSSHAAGLLAALVQMPDHAGPIGDNYCAQIGKFDASTRDGRLARMAFFAAEGAFLLRGLGIFRLEEDEWQSLFDDLERLATGEPIS